MIAYCNADREYCLYFGTTPNRFGANAIAIFIKEGKVKTAKFKSTPSHVELSENRKMTIASYITKDVFPSNDTYLPFNQYLSLAFVLKVTPFKALDMIASFP